MSLTSSTQRISRFTRAPQQRFSRVTTCRTGDALIKPLEEHSHSRLLVGLLCLWFLLQPISNDVTNYLTFRLIVNLRPDRVVFLLLIVVFLRGRKQNVPFIAAEVTLALAFVAALYSYLTVGPIDPRQRHISTLFSFLGFPLITMYITRRIPWMREQVHQVLVTFLVVGTYLGLTGVFEHYRLDFLVFPKYILDPSIGQTFGRARGPFVHAAMFGCTLIIIFFSCFLFFSLFRKSLLFRSVVAFSMAAMGAALYFSYTRGNWVMFGVAGLVMAALPVSSRRYTRYLALAILLVFVSGLSEKISLYSPTLFSRRQSTVDDRLNIMVAAWGMFKAKPILGNGYGTFERDNDEYFTPIEGVEMRGNGEGNHNAILGLLAETGVVGGLPYVLTLVLLLLSLRRRVVQHRDSRLTAELSSVALALVAGYVAIIQTTDPRFYTMVNSHLFFMVGLAHAGFADEPCGALPVNDDASKAFCQPDQATRLRWRRNGNSRHARASETR